MVSKVSSRLGARGNEIRSVLRNRKIVYIVENVETNALAGFMLLLSIFYSNQLHRIRLEMHAEREERIVFMLMF